MKLSEKQKTILLKKLKFLETTKCPLCGSKDWVVSNIVFELREFHGNRFVIGGKSAILPVISAACSKCSNTILLNALILGVVKKENESKE